MAIQETKKDTLEKVTYQTHGTCSKFICISVDEDGVVRDAQFIGGCDGNTKGVCALIRNMKAKEVIARLKGITCGWLQLWNKWGIDIPTNRIKCPNRIKYPDFGDSCKTPYRKRFSYMAFSFSIALLI